MPCQKGIKITKIFSQKKYIYIEEEAKRSHLTSAAIISNNNDADNINDDDNLQLTNNSHGNGIKQRRRVL